ncbi:MAG TPA: cobalamin-dependent protein [Phycisphaerae bacterium]|nr:cobalamin-dependent protein [Phycisphaerae bacterium]
MTLCNVSDPASLAGVVPHPLGSGAKVLLTSVFGPYARDDEYGSRLLNPMELYQNQVTRAEGPFSLRMFHRSWGLMLIQANIQAECTLLDFPTLERFLEEIRGRRYDVVGISAIIPNVLKVRRMCELIREHLPEATIVVGGHVANMPDLPERIDVDRVVRGEGVRWFRRFLSEPEDRPIRHPVVDSAYGARNVGIRVSDRPGEVAAALLPSVGCPLGCNFCSTSAMFGGKGRHIDFYRTGEELYDVMCQLERRLEARSFFVMDENFLLHRRRALRLLELMEAGGKAWALYVFSSANVIRSYTWDQLVRLGISWVWMGLEGEKSSYAKLKGIDTFELVGQMQSHGIRVLGSTIIGLDEHTPENMDGVIEYAVRHRTDFHQFMLYTPIPGTPLHADLTRRGLMKGPGDYEEADIHGQFLLNYRHPNIPEGLEAEMILRAFRRDFQVNGPSTARIARTLLAGHKRYKDHPDARVRRRFAWETRELATTFSALVAGSRLYCRDNPALRARMSELLGDLHREFGLKSRLASAIGGRYVLHKIRREEKRLAAGWTYEPPTFYETNAPVDGAAAGGRGPVPCRFVTPTVAPPPEPAPDDEPAVGAREPEPAGVPA